MYLWRTFDEHFGDQLDLLRKIFYHFNSKPYFEGSPAQQLEKLNLAAEFVQTTEDLEKRFMRIVKKMKQAYNICCSSQAFTYAEKEEIHYFVAIRSIIYKLTKKEAPDIAQMNARVAKMVEESVQSDGVEEVFKMDENAEKNRYFRRGISGKNRPYKTAEYQN